MFRRLLRSFRAEDERVRLEVVPKIAVPVGTEAVALGHDPRELAAVPGQAMNRSGLCVMVVNAGLVPATLVEIGLESRFGPPRILMREPLFHDRMDWPRTLEPGDSAVAYFASSLRRHASLGAMHRAYVTTQDNETFTGTSPALRYVVGEFQSEWRSPKREEKFAE